MLVCLAWEMLALAKSLSFPDIPRLSWPQERGRWSQAPAPFAACGGWRGESDKGASEPPWPPGSFLPIKQRWVAWRRGALSDHQRRAALWGASKSGRGLVLSARARLKSDFPLSTGA